MLRQIFTEIKRQYGVTGKAISELTGISQSHISDFLNGKRDVTSETLWRMVEAIDELAPGAKNDFARRIFGDGPEISYEGLDENELAEQMNKLGKAWKNLCSRQLAKV